MWLCRWSDVASFSAIMWQQTLNQLCNLWLFASESFQQYTYGHTWCIDKWMSFIWHNGPRTDITWKGISCHPVTCYKKERSCGTVVSFSSVFRGNARLTQYWSAQSGWWSGGGTRSLVWQYQSKTKQERAAARDWETKRLDGRNQRMRLERCWGYYYIRRGSSGANTWKWVTTPIKESHRPAGQ